MESFTIMLVSFTLSAKSGPLKETSFKFKEGDICLIGRHTECYPRLPDDHAHRTVSRRHCKISIENDTLILTDFGSLNGTYVNNSNIAKRANETNTKNTEYEIKDGDIIKLGETTFSVSTCFKEKCSSCSKIIETNRAEYLDSQGLVLCAACYMVHKQKDPAIVDKKSDISNDIHIEGYDIINLLGKGGMGSVYLAKGKGSSQPVALKVMIQTETASEASRKLFLREVEITKHLKHPNIVELIEAVSTDSSTFFTMEYCDQGAVNNLIKKSGGKLSIDDSIDIIIAALDGLDFLHKSKIETVISDGSVVESVGIVHRDIKPANIFLKTENGKLVPKIADIGLGKAFALAGFSGHTKTGSVIGTPFFMPRQLVINFKYSKAEVDVWSMAATLYNMLTGKLPRKFPKGEDPWRIVLQSAVIPIREIEPYIPPRLAEVIDYALIDNPEIKIVSASEFRDLILSSL